MVAVHTSPRIICSSASPDSGNKAYYWLGHARGAEDAGQESDLSQKTYTKRPGKFPDLSGFMTVDKGYQPTYVPGTQAPVDPGHIIYIKDTSAKDTRVNDRVMLVLFHNQPFSYTCLSFCSHPDFSGETLHSSHALVCTHQSQPPAPQLPASVQQPDTSLPRLEIKLRLNNTPFSLQPDIYLNLREHWNIEQEVRLVILGRVETNTYKRLVDDIARLFCHSLKGAEICKAREGPLAPNGQKAAKAAGVERKNSKRKDKVYLPARSKNEEAAVHVNTSERRRESTSLWPISAAYQRR